MTEGINMNKEELMDKLEIEIYDLIVKFEEETSEYVRNISIRRDKISGEINAVDIMASRYL